MRKYLFSTLALGALVALGATTFFFNTNINAQVVNSSQAQSQSAVVKVTSASQFDDLVKKSTTPIIVDFKADWCGPCHRFAPIFEQAAKDLAGKVTFLQVDVDDVPDLSNRYNIQYIPNVKLFDAGSTTPVAESGGFRDVNAIKGWLKAKANVVP